MPFNYTWYYGRYGIAISPRNAGNVYCQTDTAKSDYGKCYIQSGYGKAYFVQTDTSTYPTLPCETDGTCTRLTSTYGDYTVTTLFDFSTTGKQGILKWFHSLTHCSLTLDGYPSSALSYFKGFILPTSGTFSPFAFFGYTNFTSSPPFLGYDPVYNLWVYVNRYSIPVGYVNEIQFNDTIMVNKLTIQINLSNYNNIYFAGRFYAGVLQETSPIAVIPLDYSEYMKYNELRKTFGYSYDGISQPGWNALDIISVLKELFPDKAWMVLDDRESVLYLWNVNFSDIPDWLLNRLSPTGVKVLKSPSSLDAEKSLFAQLENRNYVSRQTA
jgi:hypothetical protein